MYSPEMDERRGSDDPLRDLLDRGVSPIEIARLVDDPPGEGQHVIRVAEDDSLAALIAKLDELR